MSKTLTIFVIEDDVAVQDSLKALLESASFNVETFNSGSEFLNGLGSQRQGCVVLDIDLPDMNGLEVLDRLRLAGVELPVILITGRLDSVTETLLSDTSAAALLEKPMPDDLLLKTIEKALEGAGRN